MSAGHAVPLDNPFLTAPIGRLFLSNALPMAVVMSMGGVLNVVDGIFVGRFIGPDALAAVSLAFPVAMVLSALATLAGGGMSSLMARHLGAGDRLAAARIFVGAHGLVLAMSAGLVGLWVVIAPMLADGSEVVALAQDYLRILILGAPVQLLVGLQADALRNEGRAGMIAALSVLVNLVNIGANWLGIVVLGLGISGSALGTVVAQALGLALVTGLRTRVKGLLPLSTLRSHSWLFGWGQIVRLGLPLCLSFIGIAMVAGIVIVSLQAHAGARAEALIAGYGIVTRLLGFAFLPQMAIALAMQSIAGNNTGAGRMDRARAVLQLAMGTALLWCLSVTLAGTLGGSSLAGWFSTDPAMIAAVAEILRPMLLLYAASGPVLVLALYFQALGQPGRTAALTLVKPWLLTPLLILSLSAGLGLSGLWLAFPVADAIILTLAAIIGRSIWHRAKGAAVREEESL